MPSLLKITDYIYYRSHFVKGSELMLLLVVYRIFAESYRKSTIAYIFITVQFYVVYGWNMGFCPLFVQYILLVLNGKKLLIGIVLISITLLCLPIWTHLSFKHNQEDPKCSGIYIYVWYPGTWLLIFAILLVMKINRSRALFSN